MRQTDYKVDKIKKFIQDTNPTKAQLVEHIVVNINNKASHEFFNKYKKHFRGYYNTNIQQMRRAGNIAIGEGGRYFVTPQGFVNEKSLYGKPDKLIIRDQQEVINRQGKFLKARFTTIASLQNEIYHLKEKLKDINILSQ